MTQTYYARRKGWRKMTWVIVLTSLLFASPGLLVMVAEGDITSGIFWLAVAFPFWLVIFLVESLIWLMSR